VWSWRATAHAEVGLELAERFMPPHLDNLAALAYGAGCFAYLAFSVQLLAGARRSPRARLLLWAAAASTLWQLGALAYLARPVQALLLMHQLSDALRFTAWALFLCALLPLAGTQDGAKTFGSRVVFLTGASLAVTTVGLAFLPLGDGRFAAILFGLWVWSSIYGLTQCETLFRSMPEERRWAIKPLCLGVAAMFGFDLFMYADAMLLRQLDPAVWSVRGLVHALAIPLVMVASARNRSWTIDIGVSRRLVFGSLALLLCGVYLLAIAGAGYYVRIMGGDWGRAMQVAFLFAAAVALALLFSSGTIRSRLRVFISKHFFSYRYDYREEWLKFTARLADDSGDPVAQRTVRALADLVESPAGALWLAAADGRMQPAGRWNVPEGLQELTADASLSEFLARSGWVIDLTEQRRHPQRYAGLTLPAWLDATPEAWLVIPLPSAQGLVGFVLLTRPRTPVEVNWEVRDLLKTTARQAAAFLGHLRAAQALAEAQQFDAFNRMCAFVVHDLKNLVAQLSLLLRNAERHGANPEFQKDMLHTVEHVAKRMQGLLLQLRPGAAVVENPVAVDVARVVERVRAPFAGDPRVVRTEVEAGLRVLGHEERLARVIGHLLQNAVDATPSQGCIAIRAWRDEDRVVIEVSDDGQGMSPEFVRTQLFKPFRSTKTARMGIGAYERQQYVTELGGRIEVESAPDAGTRVRVHLPVAGGESVRVSVQQAAA
jgi:putative PEP-CTERM system histidine kinase